MSIEVALIVTDAPPLITLAAAQRLDYLLYPKLPVIIPDAVFYEATVQVERAAAEIIRYFPLAEHERAILRNDDRDLGRIVVIDPEKIVLLSTWDYLRQLEEARRIQSRMRSSKPRANVAAILLCSTSGATTIRKSARRSARPSSRRTPGPSVRTFLSGSSKNLVGPRIKPRQA